MERAIVLRAENSKIKYYPIAYNTLLVNEGIPAQIPMTKQLEKKGKLRLGKSASMTYRDEEEKIRREGIKTPSGIFVLDDENE